MSLDLLVHAARVAAVGGVVAGALTLAVLIVRNRRRPTRPPRVKEWLPGSSPPYRWVDAPADRADVPVVIPAQRRGGTA